MSRREEFLITEENRLSLCDTISDIVTEFCRKYVKDRKEILRHRLSVENCVLEWLDEEAVGKTLILNCNKKPFLKPNIELRLSGEKKNPMGGKDVQKDDYDFMQMTLRSIGIAPSYVYKRGQNILRFNINSDSKSGLLLIVCVLMLASLIGGLGSWLAPENVLTGMEEGFVIPICDTLFRILGCIAGPMVFLSVTLGVYGIGDTSTLNRIGKRMILNYIRNDFVVGFACLLFIPLFGLTLVAAAGGDVQFGSILRLILDCFPINIIDPFSTGNTLQIIFLAFAMGIALLYLGNKVSDMARVIEQLNYVLEFFMEIITKMIPLFVFFMIVNLFWSGSIKVLSGAWKFIVLLLVAMILVTIVFFAITALRTKTSFILIVKKCLPSFLISLATASSAASFSSNMEICRNKLGVGESISEFGIPLGMVMHNPIATVNNVFAVFYFAAFYKLDCSISWFIMAVLIGTILSIASPPIPGGGTIVYTMLFLQMGIPSEALAVILTIDLLTDFLITAFEIFCLLPAVINVAKDSDTLNYEILRKEN